MRTVYRGSKEEVAALSAFVKLVRAADSVSGDTHGHLAEEGLTVSQFGVLEALYHLGPMYQRDLADHILKSPGNLTTVIRNLERRGLVRKERSQLDRRYADIVLTEAGQALIGRIFPCHAKGIARRMSLLSPAEQGQLTALCRKLAAGVDG